MDGFMITSDIFKRYLDNHGAKSAFETIKETMQNIVVLTLKAAKDHMERRKFSFEILGWDFMIDKNHQVQLIECNKSPDLNPTTKVTDNLTKKMFKDLASMLSDHKYIDLNNDDKIRHVGHWRKILFKSDNI